MLQAKLKDWKILLIEGEADHEEVKLLGQGLLNSVPVARGLSLGQLAAILKRCDIYFGNDSGISHLSAALGTTTFSFFVSTDECVWAPQGRDSRSVSIYSFDERYILGLLRDFMPEAVN